MLPFVAMVTGLYLYSVIVLSSPVAMVTGLYQYYVVVLLALWLSHTADSCCHGDNAVSVVCSLRCCR